MHFPHQTNEVVCNYFVLGLVFLGAIKVQCLCTLCQKSTPLKQGEIFFSENYFLTEFFLLVIDFLSFQKSNKSNSHSNATSWTDQSNHVI